MKKIPTIFERDWNGDRSRVLDQPHKDCGWVFAGEGWATQKLDGTCCMVRYGKLWKRRELRDGDLVPADFMEEGRDDETKKIVGWVIVGDGPDDRWHREAFSILHDKMDGTYELIGPKVQGNPENHEVHILVMHSGPAVLMEQEPPDRTFEGLRDWLATRDIEGIVFHHPDGRMAKIKKRDFGLKRKL